MNELSSEVRLVEVAAAIGDRTRARMLDALLDGRQRTATDLASIGEVSASTASSHLARLMASGLVTCIPQGKRRYYQLTGELAAGSLESLFQLAGEPRPRAVRVPTRLRVARTCYDHAAGALGVALDGRRRELGWILADGDRYTVTDAGAAELRRWEIDCDALRGQRRALARPCLDWSERRTHVAGALGAALLGSLLAMGWVERTTGSRSLVVTPTGGRRLASFGVTLRRL